MHTLDHPGQASLVLSSIQLESNKKQLAPLNNAATKGNSPSMNGGKAVDLKQT